MRTLTRPLTAIAASATTPWAFRSSSFLSSSSSASSPARLRRSLATPLVPSSRPLTASRHRHSSSSPSSSSSSSSNSHDDLPPLRDEDIVRLAKEAQHQLRLADLVRHGWPPLGEKALLQSANFSLELIPVRLARRLQALRNLPYIVVSNSHVRQIYRNYRHSLRSLLPWWRRRGSKQGAITTLDEEIAFTDVLAELVTTHQNTIPILAQGFLESRKYIAPADVTAFLDEHLRARIGTRLIAEQHIALHLSSQPFSGTPGTIGAGDGNSQAESNAAAAAAAASSETAPPASEASSYIGIIDTQLRPARTIDSCADFVADICELKYGVRPQWRIDGEPETTFAYVPMHLEYIVTELLKNAFRAVVENKMHREPVVITVAPEPSGGSSSGNESSSILPLDDNASGVTIRIRDRGGGICPDVLPNIWSYSFTTFSDYDDLPAGTSPGGGSDVSDGLNIIASSNNGGSSIAGLGYGLPLSRAYAEYFGGGIAVQSLYGWGTDVYLRLKGVGNIE
jgi:signal transduction histidine kinase